MTPGLLAEPVQVHVRVLDAVGVEDV